MQLSQVTALLALINVCFTCTRVLVFSWTDVGVGAWADDVGGADVWVWVRLDGLTLTRCA